MKDGFRSSWGGKEEEAPEKYEGFLIGRGEKKGGSLSIAYHNDVHPRWKEKKDRRDQNNARLLERERKRKGVHSVFPRRKKYLLPRRKKKGKGKADKYENSPVEVKEKKGKEMLLR